MQAATFKQDAVDLLTVAVDKTHHMNLERYWLGVMGTGDRVGHMLCVAESLVKEGFAAWGADRRGNEVLTATDKGRALVEKHRPKPGTRIYPAWESSYSGESFDRAQSLASELTDEDRRAGREAPAHGYSAANFDRARAIVDASNKWLNRAPVLY